MIIAKLRINYPTLAWHSIEVEVLEERADDVINMNLEQKAEFIYSEVKKETIQYEPYALESALDTDYATIKRINS